MSQDKRSWDSLNAGMIQSEVVRARRSLRLPLERLSNPDVNDNKDDSSWYNTDALSISAFTASSTTDKMSGASPSSQATTSSTNPQSPVLSRHTCEDMPDGRLVCFADSSSQLLDGRMKPFGQAKSLLYPLRKPVSENRIALQLRFRSDAISVLLDFQKEIALLDEKMATVLRLLKETVPATVLNVFLGNEGGQDKRDSLEGRPASGLPLEIEVYGLDNNCNNVGSILSKAGMYLQEPVVLHQEVVYRNPHFLSWDESGETPQLNTSGHQNEADFETRIGAILESSSPSLVTPGLEQDARILTRLRR
ncbi:MAG: hypothetical protein Q9170_002347 [Blastenia crenularia]